MRILKRYIIAAAAVLLGIAAWMLAPTSKQITIEQKDIIVYGSKKIHADPIVSTIHEDISKGKYIAPQSIKLTSEYSYSILDNYLANKLASSPYSQTVEYNGDPNIFYTYDNNCLKDVYRRIGYISYKISNFCVELQLKFGEFFPDIVDKCHYDIAIPLANDSDAYGLSNNGEYYFPSIDEMACRLYYPDAPLSKKFISEKYSRTMQHKDIYQYRSILHKRKYLF